jgi:hypothetical protein
MKRYARFFAVGLPFLLAAGASVAQGQERRPRDQDDRVITIAPDAQEQEREREAAARRPGGPDRGGREEQAGGRKAEEADRDNPTARLEAQRGETGVQSLELQTYILNQRRQRAGAVTALDTPAPRWLPIGPTGATYEENGVIYFERDSGRARRILPHPTDGNTVYFLTSGGGLWRTNNFNAASTTWTPLQDALGTTSGGSVAFGRTPNVLYLGTGDPFDLVNTGGSVVKSTDGGTTWGAEVDLGDVFSIRDIAVDTSDPVNDIVMVATDFGFYRSVDSGATFAKTASGPGEPFEGKSVWSFVQTSAGWLASAQVCSVAASVPGTRCGAFGTATGVIYRSTDHGATWAPVPNAGDVYSNAGRTTLAVGAPGDAIVYALAELENTSAQRDLFRSTDGGLNWVALGVNSTKNGTNGLTNPNAEQANMNLLHVQAYYNQLIAVDPADAARNTVYLGGDLATAKTADGGANWTILTNWATQFGLPYVHADSHAAVVNGGRVFFGTDGGIFLSTDAGTTWTSDKNNGLQTFLFYSIAGTPTFPNAVFGGAQDNGTRVRQGSSTLYNQSIGGDGLGAGWSETNGYAAMGSVQNNSTRRNHNGVPDFQAGWERTLPPVGASPDGAVFSTPVEVPTAAADPTGKVFFTGSAGSVYKTTDAGMTWNIIGRVGTTIPAGVALRGQVHGVGVSPVDLLHIGAVGTAGRIILTTNGGASWSVISLTAQFTAQGGFVNTSAITYADNNTIYVTSISPQLNLVRIAKTVDGGATWTRADGNGLPDVPVSRVILDPRDATHQTLFAATWVGVFRTTDGGATWSQHGVGLPNVIVRDLYMPPNGSYLRAGTYGRGFYELPSLTFVNATVDDDAVSCDHDGSLDRGETGKITVTLRNGSADALGGITATITSTNGNVVFPEGNTLTFPMTAGGADATASLPIAFAQTVAGIQTMEFAIAFDEASLGLATPVTITRSFRGNIDVVAASTADDSLSPVSAWTPTNEDEFLPIIFNWERKQFSPSDYRWFLLDSEFLSDQTLTSPSLTIGAAPLVWSFQHYHAFETSGSVGTGATAFDGMVLEISVDGGDWADVGAANIAPSYNYASIALGGGNAIEGRPAFGGRSSGYPEPLAVTVNLGTAYEGHQVRLRFRVATDDSTGRPGEHIRNIQVTGATNTPFWAVVEHLGCPSTTTLESSLNPSGPGQLVMFTANISSAFPVSGTVQFRDGATPLATVPVSSNSAAMATSGLSTGSHPITAVYSGDDDVAGSTSNIVNQVVSGAPLTCPVDPLAPKQGFQTVVNGGASKRDKVGSFDTATGDQVGAFKIVPLPRPATVALVAPKIQGTYELRLYTPNNELIGACTYRVATAPVLAISDAPAVTEGNAGTTAATFTVTLTPASDVTVTVHYATADSTANAGSDYNATSGTLTFAPGETVKSLTVQVNGDTTPEADETFLVNLSAPTASTIGDGQGQGTINNDDGPLPAVSCPTSPVPPRRLFPVIVNGGGSRLDWVASYSIGAPDKPRRAYKYVPKVRPRTVQLNAPVAPGTYEVRLFENDTFVRLGTCTYEVAAP